MSLPVLTLYIDLPDTPLRPSASDQWLARRFHDDGVPLNSSGDCVAPRVDTPPDSPSRCPSTVSDPLSGLFPAGHRRARAHPAPESYLDYLRLKFRQTAAAPPANVQKSTFSDDR
jgi:hypothetical protein